MTIPHTLQTLRKPSTTVKVSILSSLSLLLVIGVLSQMASAAPPQIIHAASASNNGNASTIAKAFTSANVAGNTIIAVASWDANTSGSAMTCTDSLGNSYVTVGT